MSQIKALFVYRLRTFRLQTRIYCKCKKQDEGCIKKCSCCQKSWPPCPLQTPCPLEEPSFPPPCVPQKPNIEKKCPLCPESSSTTPSSTRDKISIDQPQENPCCQRPYCFPPSCQWQHYEPYQPCQWYQVWQTPRYPAKQYPCPTKGTLYSSFPYRQNTFPNEYKCKNIVQQTQSVPHQPVQKSASKESYQTSASLANSYLKSRPVTYKVFPQPPTVDPCRITKYQSGCGDLQSSGNWVKPQMGHKSQRIVSPPECRQGPIPMNPCCPDHRKTNSKIYKMIFLLMIPVIGTVGYNALNAPHHHKQECIEYEYMRRRTKRFPWGDGQKTLFHNDDVNHLPDACKRPPENIVC